MINRFLKYIKIATDANPESLLCPSSEIQWDLAKVIIEDLKEIGLEDISLDENCYIMATLPSNCGKDVPTIGFIAHMDTAPTYNGKGVNPKVVKYEGGDIVLNKELDVILSPKDFPSLNKYIGEELIVTDGKTLLGADDKAGIVEIIEAVKYLKEHPEYTVDGGELGELEYENFNAASAVIKIKGRDIHPGTAKNSMINSMIIAMELNSMLPADQRPEHTENYEGFFLLNDMKGTVENTTMNYIIRDHSMKKFNEKKNLIKAVVMYLQLKYKDANIEIEVKDSYYNMREKIEPVSYIIDLAKKSMEELGIEPHIRPIRGGTDGARLSYKGLPCPNLFTGGHNFHGKFEYIPVNSMEKARDLIIKIAENVTNL